MSWKGVCRWFTHEDDLVVLERDDGGELLEGEEEHDD